MLQSGKQIITEFVENRLVTMNTNFHDSLTKRKPKTFSSLYSAHAKLDKPMCVKPDRDIFRHIIVSMVHTNVSCRDVKLPTNWNSFIEMDENKANLTHFSSNELEKKVLDHGKEIVVSGGFEEGHHSLQKHRCAGVTACVCTLAGPRYLDESKNS